MSIQPVAKFGPPSREAIFVQGHKPYIANPPFPEVRHEAMMDSMRSLPVKVSGESDDAEYVTKAGTSSTRLEVGCVAAVMKNDKELNDNRRCTQGQDQDDPGRELVVQ